MLGRTCWLLLLLLLSVLLVQTQSVHKNSLHSYRNKGVQRRATLVGRKSSEITYEQEEDEEDATATPSPSSTTAELQWMITSKMRKVLVNELGYLDAEVDEMEPQIASVVIDRNLARPSKGMPSSWRRNNVDKAVSNPLHKWKSQLQELLIKVWEPAAKYVAPILPVILLGTTLWYQKQLVGNMVSYLLSNFRFRRDNALEEKPVEKKRRWNPFSKLRNTDNQRKGNHIDFDSLERANTLSLLDKVRVTWFKLTGR